jgi:hypothetical protein
VQVRFTVGNESHESLLYVGSAVGDYGPGQLVQLVYDPSDPTRVELVGVGDVHRGVPVLLPLVIGTALGVMALVAGRHASRIGHVVRNHPWRTVPTALVEVPQSFGFRRHARIVVVLELPGGPRTVEPIGLSRVDPTFSPEALLAGLGSARMVLAAPGGGHVVAARELSGNR